MSATAVMERRVVVSMDEPSERIKRQMRAFRLEGAKLAAMILLAEPERIGEQTIGDFVMQIPYLRREKALEFLRLADVHPWREATRVGPERRRRLAGILYRYSQGRS